MKNTIQYFQPAIGSTQSSVNMDLYKQSIDLYGEGKHLEAFHTFLRHFNPELLTKYGNAEGTEFHIPHGSILVDIRIADSQMRICARFMSLPEKGAVAMLRQVAGLNTNYFDLPYFRLDGEELHIEYRCRMDQSHPAKMYGVFRQICRAGDQYDDEFETKFGAQRIYEPQVRPYEASETDRVYDAVQVICRDALAAVKEYNGDNRPGYSWNMIDTAFYQISYVARPQGQFHNDLNKAVCDMDRELPLAELVAKGSEELRRIAAMSKQALAADLYYVDTFASTKCRSSLKNVQGNFEDVYEKAEEAIGAENYEAACVRLLYKFYEMYFYNDLQDDINGVVSKALAAASGKPWKEASEILYAAMECVMEDELEDEDDLLSALSGEADGQMPQPMDGVQNIVADMQQKMQEAMAKGDMQEYMRLMGEMQQAMMAQAFGQNK